MAAITPQRSEKDPMNSVETPARFEPNVVRDAYNQLAKMDMCGGATKQVTGLAKALVDEIRKGSVAVCGGSTAQVLGLGYSDVADIVSPRTSPESVMATVTRCFLHNSPLGPQAVPNSVHSQLVAESQVLAAEVDTTKRQVADAAGENERHLAALAALAEERRVLAAELQAERETKLAAADDASSLRAALASLQALAVAESEKRDMQIALLEAQASAAQAAAEARIRELSLEHQLAIERATAAADTQVPPPPNAVEPVFRQDRDARLRRLVVEAFGAYMTTEPFRLWYFDNADQRFGALPPIRSIFDPTLVMQILETRKEAVNPGRALTEHFKLSLDGTYGEVWVVKRAAVLQALALFAISKGAERMTSIISYERVNVEEVVPEGVKHALKDVALVFASSLEGACRAKTSATNAARLLNSAADGLDAVQRLTDPVDVLSNLVINIDSSFVIPFGEDALNDCNPHVNEEVGTFVDRARTVKRERGGDATTIWKRLMKALVATNHVVLREARNSLAGAEGREADALDAFYRLARDPDAGDFRITFKDALMDSRCKPTGQVDAWLRDLRLDGLTDAMRAQKRSAILGVPIPSPSVPYSPPPPTGTPLPKAADGSTETNRSGGGGADTFATERASRRDTTPPVNLARIYQLARHLWKAEPESAKAFTDVPDFGNPDGAKCALCEVFLGMTITADNPKGFSPTVVRQHGRWRDARILNGAVTAAMVSRFPGEEELIKREMASSVSPSFAVPEM